jgi:DNA-binding SARP family transcriptional activator
LQPALAPEVSVRLLGTFVLEVDRRPVALPTAAQRLVALLALRGRTGRSRLAGLLWPEAEECRALANLRTGIWRVNKAAAGLVVCGHGAVGLGLSAVVDVDRLIARSRAVLGGQENPDPEPGATGPGAEPDLGTGELLPDWEDPWLDTERERLLQLHLHVLESNAARLASSGRYGMALEFALAALRVDILRESAHRAVMSIHLAEGNLAEVRRAYDACRRTLATELGIEPSPLTNALAARLAPDALTGMTASS